MNLPTLRRRLCAVFLAVVCLLTLCPSAFALNDPNIQATAVYLGDPITGLPLYEKNAEELRQKQIAARREEEKELEQDLKEHFVKDKRTLRWNVLGAIIFIIINTIVLLWIGEKIMWM